VRFYIQAHEDEFTASGGKWVACILDLARTAEGARNSALLVERCGDHSELRFPLGGMYALEVCLAWQGGFLFLIYGTDDCTVAEGTTS
jgi:hypothetical protein